MPETHINRRAALRAELVDRGLDALLVTDLLNIRYLTGFTGSAGLVVVTPDELVLVTRTPAALTGAVEKMHAFFVKYHGMLQSDIDAIFN